MSRLPDYNDMFDMYDRERQAELDKLPNCDYCNQPIQDEHLYDFDGDLVCEECLKDYFRKNVEDYME